MRHERYFRRLARTCMREQRRTLNVAAQQFRRFLASLELELQFITTKCTADIIVYVQEDNKSQKLKAASQSQHRYMFLFAAIKATFKEFSSYTNAL